MYKPKICSIELLRQCCLRCRMCYIWKIEKTDQQLDISLLTGLADQLETILTGEKEVAFSGGETLLHPDIVDIVRIYSQRGFKVGLVSNGMPLTEEMAAQLVEAGLQHIQLSLDSVYSDTHNFLRGAKTAYESVLRAADHMSRYKDKILIGAQTVISGKNIDEIIDTIRFVKKDERFAHISFMAVTAPFFAPVENNWMSSEEFSFLWPRDMQKVDTVIDEILALKKEGYPIANPASHFELFRAYFHDPLKRKEEIACLLGDYLVGINPAGDVRICCLMPPIGNIREKPLADILSAPAIDGMRQDMHSCRRVCNTLVNCFFRESVNE